MGEAKGQSGTVRFDGQFVTIAREGRLARMSMGAGEKRIPVSSISAVQMKPAGALVNGFIQFTISGGTESNKQRGGRTMAAVQDENSVVFTKGQQPAFEGVRVEIEEAIAARYAPQQPADAGPSAMDQLGQLQQMLDAGLISQAEFDAKRAEIIARM